MSVGSSVTPSRFGAILACALVAAGTVLGLSGIDLVLPAIPQLPEILGGEAAAAQLVIAAFVAGTAGGLLLFGALGGRYGRRYALVAALAAYAALSFLAARAETMPSLIILRFFQGVAASAPAVFAPGIIRALFDEIGATKALGALASVESLVPAGAPVVGVWLLTLGDWTLSFTITAVLAALLAVSFIFAGRVLPPDTGSGAGGSYARLLGSPVYMRYALTQALVLGGLLVFVFGAPAVIVRTMGGSLQDFIVMQVSGVTCFIVASNVTGWLVGRFGAERLILTGTTMALLSALALLSYAVAGGKDPGWLPYLFVPMNVGLGLRGPPGFLRAIIAGGGDDDRAASLMILAITGVSAGGTALFAPFIESGLLALSLAATAIQGLAVLLLLVLPPLQAVPKTGPRNGPKDAVGD